MFGQREVPMPRPWGQEGAWQGLGVRSSMWSVGQGEIVEGQANPAGPGRCGEGLGVQEGMWGDQARDGHAISMEEGVATAGTDGRQRGGQTGGHSLAQHGVRQLELSRQPHGAEPRTSLVGPAGTGLEGRGPRDWGRAWDEVGVCWLHLVLRPRVRCSRVWHVRPPDGISLYVC